MDSVGGILAMALKAAEWILLPKKEQEKRADELSPHECLLLRTVYDYCHPTEEQKAAMTEEERAEFLREPTEKEVEAFNKEAEAIIKRIKKKISEERKN